MMVGVLCELKIEGTWKREREDVIHSRFVGYGRGCCALLSPSVSREGETMTSTHGLLA